MSESNYKLPSNSKEWDRKVFGFRISLIVLSLVFTSIALIIFRQEFDLFRINGITTAFFIGIIVFLFGVGFLLPALQKKEKIQEVMKRNPERFFPTGDSAPWWGWIIGFAAVAGIVFVGYRLLYGN